VAFDTPRTLVVIVFAHAVCAVFGIHVFAAAVTTVPTAFILVVAVVAMTVTLEFWQITITFAFDALGVTALARITVNELFQVFFFGVTTIAAIPVATFDVVFVVAVLVTLELRALACLFSIHLWAVAAFARAFENGLENIA